MIVSLFRDYVARSIMGNKDFSFFLYESFPSKSIENRIFLIRISYFGFCRQWVDPSSNKRKKVSDSSIRKSKKINMWAEIFSKSSNLRRQRNLVLESRIDFHVSKRLLAAINGHIESSDHNRDRWIVDSGANAHVCNDLKWLLNPIDLSNGYLHLCLVDGKKVKIEDFGDVYLKFDQGSFIIRRVTCVTKLSMNVISVAKLYDKGCKILFTTSQLWERMSLFALEGSTKGYLSCFLSLLDLELIPLPSWSWSRWSPKWKKTKILSCDIRGWLTWNFRHTQFDQFTLSIWHENGEEDEICRLQGT